MQQGESACNWPGNDPLMVSYHNEEWGVPVHDDKKHFEFLVLDAFQAGLSWQIVLKKREGFRQAFAGFDPDIVGAFSEKDVLRLREDPAIIRNKAKISATIHNARRFLEVQKEFGSFDKFIWQFTDYKTLHNRWDHTSQLPAKTEVSEKMSKELIRRGFKFCGPTICYAYMQAAGIVNDHLVHCFRYKELIRQ